MSSVRLRRLVADSQKLRAFVMRQPRVRLIQAEGNPPERYQLEFHVRSLRQVDGELKAVNRHLVEITLPRNYPRTPPQCRMLSPIFHPNIAPHAICIGDHWSAGEPLWSMVARIGEMIAYQSYNTKSPLNGEAARWADQNESRLPLDPSPLYVEEPDAGPAAAAPSAVAAPPPAPRRVAPVQPPPPPPSTAGSPALGASSPAVRISVVCPGCGARYAAQALSTAKTARCRRCQAIVTIPAAP